MEPGAGTIVARRNPKVSFSIVGGTPGPRSPGALLDTGATTNIVARVVPLSDADLTKVLEVNCTLGTIAAVT